MGVRRLSLASISNGVKYSKFWDGVTVSIVPQGIIAGGTPALTRIDKLTFSTEVRTTAATGLVTGKNAGAALSRQGVGGYFAGGVNDTTSTWYSSITKYLMGADTNSNIGATLAKGMFVTGFDNTTVAGYAVGGYDPNQSSISQNTTQKLTYATEARTTLGATYEIRGAGTTQNTSVAGYYAGGYIGSSASYTNGIRKFPYSTETYGSLGTGLTYSRIISAGTENLSTAGYIWGGVGSSFTNIIQKIAFSNDTVTTISATMSADSAYVDGGVSYSSIAGYHCGSYNSTGGGTAYNDIQKLTYSNETRSTISATLSVAANSVMALSQVS